MDDSKVKQMNERVENEMKKNNKKVDGMEIDRIGRGMRMMGDEEDMVI